MHTFRARAATAIATVAVAGLATACGHSAVALQPIPWPSGEERAGAAATPDAARPGATLPEPVGLDATVAGRLPALTGRAVAWRLSPDATRQEVARLAAAFGLTGPVHVTASGWSVSDRTRTLTVEPSGGAFFTYSATTGIAGGGCRVDVPISRPGTTAGAAGATASGGATGAVGASPGQATAAPSTGTTWAICPQAPVAAVTTPVRVGRYPVMPTEAQSIRLVQTVLTHAGLPVAGSPATATTDGTGWTVQLSASVGGVRIANSPFMAIVGAGPTITYATGYLATPVDAGEYPLSGTQAALVRLRDGIDVLSSSGYPDSTAVSGSSSPSPSGGTTSVNPCPANAMCAPLPSPSPVRLTITGAQLALALVPAVASPSAAAWLAPAYVFELSDGSTATVLAVAGREVTVAPPTQAEGTGVPLPAPATGPATGPAATGS